MDNFHCVDVMYHHSVAVWGVRIQDDVIITGSMDGMIAVIDIATRVIQRHFLAHEDEWGGKNTNGRVTKPLPSS